MVSWRTWSPHSSLWAREGPDIQWHDEEGETVAVFSLCRSCRKTVACLRELTKCWPRCCKITFLWLLSRRWFSQLSCLVCVLVWEVPCVRSNLQSLCWTMTRYQSKQTCLRRDFRSYHSWSYCSKMMWFLLREYRAFVSPLFFFFCAFFFILGGYPGYLVKG